MNQKKEKKLSSKNGQHTRIIYYAPVASTRGESVKIYRFAFERISEEYRQRAEAELHPLRKAVIRYEWAHFILKHINEYAGQREPLLQLAQTLAHNARFDAKQIISKAESQLHQAQKRLRNKQKLCGFIRAEDGSMQSPSRGLTRKEKNELADLQSDMRAASAHLNELRHICPDRMYDKIMSFDTHLYSAK